MKSSSVFSKKELALVHKISNEIEPLLVERLNKNPDLAILVLCNLISRVCDEGEVPKESVFEVLELALAARGIVSDMDDREKEDLLKELNYNLDQLNKKTFKA